MGNLKRYRADEFKLYCAAALFLDNDFKKCLNICNLQLKTASILRTNQLRIKALSLEGIMLLENKNPQSKKVKKILELAVEAVEEA